MKRARRLLCVGVAGIMLTATLSACGGEAISVMGRADSYTFNDCIAADPVSFDPHDRQTTEDGYVASLTQMGLYETVLNDSGDGYDIVPEMAAEKPRDVTAEYAGSVVFGVPSGAQEGYAYAIALNPDACWSDGSPITAADYVSSMQRLLDPAAGHCTAPLWYAGELVVANAGKYNEGAGVQYRDIYDKETGEYALTAEQTDEMWFSCYESCPFWGDSMEAGYGVYSEYFIYPDGTDCYKELERLQGDKEYIPVTDEVLEHLKFISQSIGGGYDEEFMEFCFYAEETTGASWDQVGILATGEYEITVILEKPLSAEKLMLLLPAGIPVKSADGETVNLGEEYLSCGPYRIAEYLPGESLTFERNDAWYGYADGKHEGQFKADKIYCRIISDSYQAEELFLSGELDRLPLSASQAGAYRNSPYLRLIPESYTTKISFNSSYDALKERQTDGVNKVILSYPDFRRAIAMCIDRESFAAAIGGSQSAFYGLLSDSYVYDETTGASYRSSDEGKSVLDDIYGAEREKCTADEARGLFISAYNKALAAGDIGEGDVIELEFLVYSEDEPYTQMVNLVQESIDTALEGTILQGRVHLTVTGDENYYDSAQRGQFEMIWSTWGGAEDRPWDIMECYCTAMRFEYGFDYRTEKLTVKLPGGSVTKTYEQWYEQLCAGEYADEGYDVKLAVLSAMERGILSYCGCTPVYCRNGAELISRKCSYPTDEYVSSVGFGGMRYVKFMYTDSEWEYYCGENGGSLSY